MKTSGFLLIPILVAISSSGQGQSVEVHGADLYVDVRPFTVKGIHYGPWRPGTGPNKGYPYPTASHCRSG